MSAHNDNLSTDELSCGEEDVETGKLLIWFVAFLLGIPVLGSLGNRFLLMWQRIPLEERSKFIAALKNIILCGILSCVFILTVMFLFRKPINTLLNDNTTFIVLFGTAVGLASLWITHRIIGKKV